MDIGPFLPFIGKIWKFSKVKFIASNFLNVIRCKIDRKTKEKDYVNFSRQIFGSKHFFF